MASSFSRQRKVAPRFSKHARETFAVGHGTSPAIVCMAQTRAAAMQLCPAYAEPHFAPTSGGRRDCPGECDEKRWAGCAPNHADGAQSRHAADLEARPAGR